jgi:hypothetical protein
MSSSAPVDAAARRFEFSLYNFIHTQVTDA